MTEGRFVIERVTKAVAVDPKQLEDDYNIEKRMQAKRLIVLPPKKKETCMENKKKTEYKRWTADELIFLADNRGKLTYKEIAEKLGRTAAAVNYQASTLNRKNRKSASKAPAKKPVENMKGYPQQGRKVVMLNGEPAYRHDNIDNCNGYIAALKDLDAGANVELFVEMITLKKWGM